MTDDPVRDEVVTFYGGMTGIAELLVPYARSHTRVRLFVRYPCGCVGFDVFERIGDVAFCAYHEPAPEHRLQWVEGTPPLDGDEWKNPHRSREDGS